MVALNGDRSTARRKGPGRPILSAAERAEIVAALEGVDLVIPFEEDDVAAILERLRPDVHCKGTDYTRESVPERDISSRLGIETRIVGDPKSHSSRDLIATIAERFGKKKKGYPGG